MGRLYYSIVLVTNFSHSNSVSFVGKEKWIAPIQILKNNSLKEATILACNEIAFIRKHLHEFITSDINNNLKHTSVQLKEKIETEKRIREELCKF